MTRQQENRLEDLALLYGRLAVRDGYADHAVRVTLTSGRHLIIRDDDRATVADGGLDFSVHDPHGIWRYRGGDDR
jgi:hypothetical protein